MGFLSSANPEEQAEIVNLFLVLFSIMREGGNIFILNFLKLLSEKRLVIESLVLFSQGCLLTPTFLDGEVDVVKSPSIPPRGTSSTLNTNSPVVYSRCAI